jgi:hypothetical protein
VSTIGAIPCLTQGSHGFGFGLHSTGFGLHSFGFGLQSESILPATKLSSASNVEEFVSPSANAQAVNASILNIKFLFMRYSFLF